MRFGALQKELELHPPQVARALRFLTKSKLIELAAADTATEIGTDGPNGPAFVG